MFKRLLPSTAGAQSGDQHGRHSISGSATPSHSSRVVADIRKKGAHQETPHSSTSKVTSAEERELGQQLLEREAEILELHVNFRDQASRHEHERQNLQTAAQKALNKKDNDMRQLSDGFKSTLDEKDKEIEGIRRHSNTLFHAYESLEKDNRTLQRKAGRAIGALQDQLTQAEQDLDLCRDDLFRLQPVCRISDASILTAFKSLGDQLINWIDNEISAFEKANPDAHAGCLFSGSESSDVAHLLQMYPSAGEYLCRHMVNRYLLEHIFGSDVHRFGFSAEHTHVRLAIEHGMVALDPPKGTSSSPVDFLAVVLCLTIPDSRTVNIWRAETLSALAVTPECKDMRSKHTCQLTLDLVKYFSPFLPHIFRRGDAMQGFHDQVAIPAATIVSNLQGSASQYRLDMAGKDFRNRKRLTREDLRSVIAIDVKTGKTLKPSGAFVSSRDGFLGSLLLPLEPSLHRVNEGRSDTVLRRETWLVSLHDAREDHARGD